MQRPDRRPLAAVAAFTIVGALVVKWLGILVPGHLELLLTSVATALAAPALMRWTALGRSSELNRRLGWSLTAVVCAAPFARGGAWIAGVSVPRMLAFELLGAPGLDGRALARAIEAPGVRLRPLELKPMFGKHAGQVCGGVQVHVTDRTALRSFALYARILEAAHGQLGSGFWRTDAYEFVVDTPAIDLLFGGPELRESLERGEPIDAILTAQDSGAQDFDGERQEVLRYP